MLSFLNRIFSSPPKVPVSASPAAVAPNEHTSSVPAVEVARLRLSAILERFPDELKPLVLKMPEESVTVALPVSTILKQLASGSVRVSLATVHRQAPAGVFGPLPPGDKRLVEVPLHEVFRHVSPQTLKRRADQRAADGLTSEFNLFGNAQQPYQIAPTAPDEGDLSVPPAAAPKPAPAAETPALRPPVADPELSIQPARVIAPPPEFPQPLAFKPTPPPTPATPLAPAAAPEPVAPPIPRLSIVRPEPPTPAPSAPPPPPAAPVLTLSPNVPELPTDRVTAPPPGDVSIEVAIADLSTAWPEPIRQELAVLNGSGKIALPKSQVTAGLARGRVSFTWKQIASWLQPGLPQPSAQDEATELTLPLKVVAPLFLATTRKAKPAAASFDTDIPALFADARQEPTPAPVEAEAAPAEIAPQPVAESAPVVAEVAPSPTAAPIAPPPPPATVGELFGEPGRTEWTPAQLVAGLAKRPGISGAVVALQEGLLVAHSLPEDVKSETIAAFLPQIFARLNQYSGEMKLGEVDDILFTTHGAHCQIYRLGFVYFAVLGKPGEPLPWSELRLVAEELARQTQPKD